MLRSHMVDGVSLSDVLSGSGLGIGGSGSGDLGLGGAWGVVHERHLRLVPALHCFLEKPFFPWGWRHAEHILVDGFVGGLVGAGGGEVGAGEGEGVVFSGEGGGVVGWDDGWGRGEGRRAVRSR